jgi:L-ascorbate metabolism protein UlaG (beta-lactamase superfamily)
LLDYKVIASGSKGNAVRIENVMIDCGVPFSKMREELYKCDTLLITHTHSDHVRPGTLERIKKEFPRIQVCGNHDVAYHWQVDKIVGEKEFVLKRSGIKVLPQYGKHDVAVTYYFLSMPDSTEIIYATDTYEVINPDERRLDYFFLEGNYNPQKLEQMASQYSSHGYDPWKNAMRHFSHTQCREFYYTYRRSKESELIVLHKSERFF